MSGYFSTKIMDGHNHTEQQVMLLDIGSHKKLKIGGATNESATSIYGGLQ